MADDRTSYKLGVTTTCIDDDSELARLRARAEVAWPKEAEALIRAGLADDADVLEAGCGPGFISRRLLELIPRGTLTSLDRDARMLELAQAGLGEREGVRFVEASATDIPLPDASFDVVHARLLLQHVPEPGAAVDEFRRVLRPGGRLIVVDVDDAFWLLLHPEPPFARKVIEAMAELQRMRGGDRSIGRRLPALLTAGGFADLGFGAVFAHSAIAGFPAVRNLLTDQAVDGLAALGLLDAATAAEVRAYFAAADAGEIDVAGALGLAIASGTAP